MTVTANNATNVAYLNHWIRLNSAAENAIEIATNALRGVRVEYSLYSRKVEEYRLVMPDGYSNHKMSALQLKAAKQIARSFGHLWAQFNSAFEWADHFNMGGEDGWNFSNHSHPTWEDSSASGRFQWAVNRLGTVDFEICRPQGTACRIVGKMDSFVITITKLCLDRHLKCLFQRLQATFGLSPEEAIERIETCKGFNTFSGIRGGELHKVLNEPETPRALQNIGYGR